MPAKSKEQRKARKDKKKAERILKKRSRWVTK